MAGKAAKGKDRHSATPLRELVRTLRPAIAGIALFSLCANLLSLAVPLFLLQVYDRVLPSRSIDTLVVLVLVAGFAVLASGALDAVRGVLLARMGTWTEVRFGGSVLSGLVEQARERGKSSVQGLRDLQTVRHFLAGAQVVPLLDAPWTPVFILVLYVLHPLIGTITLVGALVLVALAVINNMLSREPAAAAGDAQGHVLEVAGTATRNAEAISAMGMRANVVRRWEAQSIRGLELSTRSQARSRWLQSIARLVRVALQLGVICAAAWLIINGQITGGGLLASVLLMRRAITPMERAITAWPSVMRARRAFGRVSRHAERGSQRQRALQPPVGSLTVKQLRFYHPDTMKPVLRKVSFEVRPGEAVAVVGPTGTGKSTLASLLVGNSRPYSGHVYLGGVDVTSWDPEMLGPHIGYLPQSEALLDGTIAENIARMGKVDAKSVFAAMEVAGITDMVRALPEGADTRIGPDGVRLSGGQRQRVALARAVFGRPRLVILDEPDAHLDKEGREKLDRAILVLKSYDAIVVMITHQVRPSGAIDRIIELRDGMVERPSRESSSRSKPRLAGT